MSKYPSMLTEQELNIIRGKVLAGAASQEEILAVFMHYDLVEIKLDEADNDDMLGTQGWRYFVGLPDAT